MTTQFYVRPGAGERITAEVCLEQDERSALYGTVRDGPGRPLPGALVMLMELAEPGGTPAFRAATFTDEDGQYYLGPLASGALYRVKVFYQSVKIRELEIVREA